MPRSKAAQVAATYQTRAHNHDNLKAAVVRILVGGARALTQARFAALASHYLLEACFCRPGEGHDKGGVESRGKAVRQQALVPIPAGGHSRRSMTRCWPAWTRASRPRGMRPVRRSARALPRSSASAARPAALCAGGHDVGDGDAARAGPAGGRGLLGAESLGGLDLVVRVGATTVTIVGQDGTLVRHLRKRFGERSIDYRHYLAELARKPQAVRQVLPELLRDLGAPFPAMWDQLEEAHGPRDAARLLAKILGQLDTQGAAVVVPALTAALAAGTPLLLALTPARTALDRLDPDAVPEPLRTIEVGSGCAADYDAWLVEVAG